MTKLSLLSLICLGCTCFFTAPCLQAQETMIYEQDTKMFREAKAFFLQSDYGLAYPLLKILHARQHGLEEPIPGQTPRLQFTEVDFYTLACGLMLNEPQAAAQANEMIALSVSKPHVQMLSYYLAEYYFRNKEYEQAAALYSALTPDNLSNADIATYKFHYAYVLFQDKQFAQARPLFDAIRQIPNDPNYIDANYYYGFISFYDKKYTDALKALIVVDNSETYSNLVPYYITQIYYFNGEKEKALSYAQDKLRKGGQYYELQMKQLVGHIYFEKKDFARALPFLEEYVTRTPRVRREDLYELSYSYYATGNTAKAIPGLKELGGEQDSLAQNSMFILGNAYLKLNEFTSARSAFQFCKNNSSNAVQKEIASFHYAKLSYSLGLLPVAISEMKLFLTSFSHSSYNTEGRELLVEMLGKTNNFQEGLRYYESVPQPGESVLKIYPKLLYGRMVELANDRQDAAAAELLNRLAKAPYNNTYLPAAMFWKAELEWRSGDVPAAEKSLAEYKKNPAGMSEVNPVNAAYLEGYIALSKQQYPEAARQFSRVAPTNLTTGSSAIQQDAWVRLADTWFVQKQYAKASSLYESVNNLFLPQSDYALYQLAIISGASGRETEKLARLQQIRSRYPQSSYASDAALEIANTYIASEKYIEALKTLGELITSPAYSRALEPGVLIRQGISHFNMNDNVQALVPFRKLLLSYPNSPEAEDAVDYIRTAYIELQQPDQFARLMQQSNRTISVQQQDSLQWIVVSNIYQQKKYDDALPRLDSYLNNFPQGEHRIEALYYSAFIHNQKKAFPQAIRYYDSVSALAPNRFAEQSLLQSARISFFEQQNYEAAAGYFNRLSQAATTADNKLEALRGELRARYKLNQLTEAVPAARELVIQRVLAADDKMLAYTVLARQFQMDKVYDSAQLFYARVVALGKSEFGAEARFRQAEIQFEQNKPESAEKLAFSAIEKMGSYDYWITKSYLLLGDIYAAQKDWFNAMATYKSVSENATDSQLKAEAQVRLLQVEARQSAESKLIQP